MGCPMSMHEHRYDSWSQMLFKKRKRAVPCYLDCWAGTKHYVHYPLSQFQYYHVWREDLPKKCDYYLEQLVSQGIKKSPKSK